MMHRKAKEVDLQPFIIGIETEGICENSRACQNTMVFRNPEYETQLAKAVLSPPEVDKNA